MAEGDNSLSPVASASVAPVPTAAVETKLAPGKKGPVGLAPRTNYSRVNTGVPPVSDAGASAQKSISPRLDLMAPKVASAGEMKMSPRIPVTEMIKAAYAGVATRSKTASVQSASAGAAQEKTASFEGDSTSTTHVMKVAHALEMLLKEAEDPKTTETANFHAGTPVAPNQTGHSVVKAPADKQSPPGKMVTTETDWNGKGPQKVASHLKALQKTAADTVTPGTSSTGAKRLEVTDAGPGVDGSSNLIASNEAATNFTKRDAKSHEKSKLKAYLDEPAQSASTDPVLNKTLEHTSGAKIAGVAAQIKSAAAKGLIQKLAEEMDEADKKKKKSEAAQAAC